MKVNLMTRGTTDDYSYLGKVMDGSIRSEYGLSQYGSGEQASIFLINTGSELKCVISGIPSRRVDRVQTRIHYTLQLFGERGDGPAIANIVGHAVSACDGFRMRFGSLSELLESKIGHRMDSEFSAEGRKSPEAARAVSELVGPLESLPKSSPGSKIEANLLGLVRGEPDAPQIAARFNFIESKDSDLIEEVEKNFSRYSKIMIFPVEHA